MEALKLDPDNAAANLDLGNCMLMRSYFDAAIKCFTAGIGRAHV